MESKQSILDAIRRRLPPAQPLPDLQQDWIVYGDRLAQFSQMLEFVGGRCVPAAGLPEVNAALDQLKAYQEAKRIVSLVDGAGRNTVDMQAIDDARQLEDLDFAILPGQFGVAENGAIWITDAGLKHRAVPFIVQHLALVVPADQLLDNMHQAYERLKFEQPGFGVFISGPSKTADIEQSLVIGAHGPRSLTVFCMQ